MNAIANVRVIFSVSECVLINVHIIIPIRVSVVRVAGYVSLC